VGSGAASVIGSGVVSGVMTSAEVSGVVSAAPGPSSMSFVTALMMYASSVERQLREGPARC
jgi:hypothetical protein